MIEEQRLPDMVKTTYQDDFVTGVKQRIVANIKEKVNEDLQ